LTTFGVCLRAKRPGKRRAIAVEHSQIGVLCGYSKMETLIDALECDRLPIVVSTVKTSE
jgi:hypothetical protein